MFVFNCLDCFRDLSYTSFPQASRPKLQKQASFVDDFWRPPNSTPRSVIQRFNFEVSLSAPSQVPSSPVNQQSKRTINGFLGRFFGPTGTERQCLILLSLWLFCFSRFSLSFFFFFFYLTRTLAQGEKRSRRGG